MTDAPFDRLSAFVDLTDKERAAMRNMVGYERSFATAECIRAEGDETIGLFFLDEGWALSSTLANRVAGSERADEASR